jgi:hypothetical protein
MKYTAHLVTGETIMLELNENFDSRGNGGGWLVDNVRAMVNLAHVCALVPGTTAPSDPERITDGGGDVWVRNAEGTYDLLGEPVRGYAGWSRVNIERSYGIQE